MSVNIESMSDISHVRIAYLVIVYEDPQQLARLIKRLAEDADVYIHINKRVKIGLFKYAVEKIHVNGKVRFIEHGYKVNWGGYSILRAICSLLDEAFSNKMYDRVILLTGLDHPIKTTEQIQDFFIKNKDIHFISTKMIDGKEYATLNRMYYICGPQRG